MRSGSCSKTAWKASTSLCRLHPSRPRRAERYHELCAWREGLPCTFHPNIARDDLAALYERSAVLVHAAGYGVDPDEFPESLEHFGITPVEASSFGCIPVVYGQGGPSDVIAVLGMQHRVPDDRRLRSYRRDAAQRS